MKSPILALLALSVLAVLTNGTGTFSNPLRTRNGSDPFIVFVDGYYYLMTTTWTDVQLTRAPTLDGLKTGETRTLYTMANPNPNGGNDVWAPELHRVNGTWYVYFSEGRKSWVLTGGPEPWGTYDNKIQVHQEWGIDSTLVEIPSRGTYYVWSCMSAWNGEDLQSLCIAPLVNGTSIGPWSVLSRPTEPWERIGVPVNEGPAGLNHAGRTWVAYSASFCKTPDYSVAALRWDGVGDPLEAGSWTKSGGPLFQSARGEYGTAHNGFFTSPDGTEIWNVYHATQNANGSCGADRQTFAQKVGWKADGSPDLGVPAVAGEVLQAPSGEKAV